jgi:hypothetical protein
VSNWQGCTLHADGGLPVCSAMEAVDGPLERTLVSTDGELQPL